jgi:hypothetical protein
VLIEQFVVFLNFGPPCDNPGIAMGDFDGLDYVSR